MNRNLKLGVFIVFSISVSLLYYFKFEQNIKNIGLLNFIGIETFIIVFVCHGIAFFVRSFLVKRHCSAAGFTHGKEVCVHDLSIINKPLFTKIRKSYNKAAVFLIVFTLVATRIWIYLAFNIKDQVPIEWVKMRYETHRTRSTSMFNA
jgi:hypothetical protein